MQAGARIRHFLAQVGEFIFIVDALFVGVTVALVVIGHVDVLHSSMGLLLPVSTAIIVTLHQVWYSRHRDEIEHGPVHNAIRERRGF